MHKFKNWIETNKSTIQTSNVYDLIDSIINNKSVGGLSLVDITAFALSIAYLKNEFDQFYFEVIADKSIVLKLKDKTSKREEYKEYTILHCGQVSASTISSPANFKKSVKENLSESYFTFLNHSATKEVLNQALKEIPVYLTGIQVAGLKSPFYLYK